MEITTNSREARDTRSQEGRGASEREAKESAHPCRHRSAHDWLCRGGLILHRIYAASASSPASTSIHKPDEQSPARKETMKGNSAVARILVILAAIIIASSTNSCAHSPRPRPLTAIIQ